MALSKEIEIAIDADIDEKLPQTTSVGDPKSLVLIIPSPGAPMISVSRDQRLGSVVVPHLFIAADDPEVLLPLGTMLSKNILSLMPMFHTISAKHTGKFLLFPFLFDHGHTSCEFIRKASEMGEFCLSSPIKCAYRITDCQLDITNGGVLRKPEDYPNAINHLDILGPDAHFSASVDSSGESCPDIEVLHALAKGRNANAQFTLASCYLTGDGVAKDINEAANWYRKAAEQNIAGAQFALGGFYQNGIGVPKNPREGFDWYRKAAEQGLADAQFHLGNCYINGDGVTMNLNEAMQWFVKAAAQGYSPPANFGKNFNDGVATTKDAKSERKPKGWRVAIVSNSDVPDLDAPVAYYLSTRYESVEAARKAAINWNRSAREDEGMFADSAVVEPFYE